MECTEVPEPPVKEGHVVLRINTIGICGTDLHAFEGTQPFFRYPRVLGHELSGEIAAGAANGFSDGERVTFLPYFHCGTCIACRNGKSNCCMNLDVCGVHIDGGMAEYYSVPVSHLVHGDGLTDEQLALVEPLAIGAHGIRRAAVAPGEPVLVMGAGPIGLAAMSFAIIAGAKVIAMDVRESRLAYAAARLPLTARLNPLDPETPEKLAAITHREMAPVVIDATGNLAAIRQGFHYMAHGGRYVLIGLQKEDISFSHPEFHKREGTLMSSRNATRDDFERVIRSIRDGSVDPLSWITHRLPFSEAAGRFSSLLDPAGEVVKAMIAF